MFTAFLDWIKPLITGFAGAWSWLITPIITFPETNWQIGPGLTWVSVPSWSVTPISVISVAGFAVLFIFGLAKTLWDSLPVV